MEKKHFSGWLPLLGRTGRQQGLGKAQIHVTVDYFPTLEVGLCWSGLANLLAGATLCLWQLDSRALGPGARATASWVPDHIPLRWILLHALVIADTHHCCTNTLHWCVIFLQKQ
jgi:hypothetical protein